MNVLVVAFCIWGIYKAIFYNFHITRNTRYASAGSWPVEESPRQNCIGKGDNAAGADDGYVGLPGAAEQQGAIGFVPEDEMDPSKKYLTLGHCSNSFVS